MNKLFVHLLSMNRKGKVADVILSLDPGHTTGYAVFKRGELVADGTITTVVDDKPHWYELLQLLKETKPTCLVVENYRVYEHKLDRHSFSEVLTLRVIGGIDMWAFVQEVPIIYQMASMAKGFTDDDKLRKFGMHTDNKHARDAIRHGIYAMLFFDKDKDMPEKKGCLDDSNPE